MSVFAIPAGDSTICHSPSERVSPSLPLWIPRRPVCPGSRLRNEPADTIDAASVMRRIQCARQKGRVVGTHFSKSRHRAHLRVRGTVYRALRRAFGTLHPRILSGKSGSYTLRYAEWIGMVKLSPKEPSLECHEACCTKIASISCGGRVIHPVGRSS
jgi:hypothetical protein